MQHKNRNNFCCPNPIWQLISYLKLRLETLKMHLIFWRSWELWCKRRNLTFMIKKKNSNVINWLDFSKSVSLTKFCQLNISKHISKFNAIWGNFNESIKPVWRRWISLKVLGFQWIEEKMEASWYWRSKGNDTKSFSKKSCFWCWRISGPQKKGGWKTEYITDKNAY